VCSTWNILGVGAKLGNVPRGTNTRTDLSVTWPEMKLPGKTVVSTPGNRKFSTEARNYSGRHDALSGYRERLPSQGFAALASIPPQEAFHSFARFSTCQLATVKSPSPFNLNCHE